MKKWISIIAVVMMLSSLLTGCDIEGRLESILDSIYYDDLDRSRPENGSKFPLLDGEITDVRIQVQTRDYTIDDSQMSYIWDNIEFLQIYYGYQKNGQWQDYPCENYDIVSIFNSYDYDTKEEIIQYGYDAADGSHIVKIGEYILFSIDLPILESTLDEVIVYDSANTEFQLMFQEYHTYYASFSDKDMIDSGYGYLKEDIDKNNGKLKDCQISDTFHARYYGVVKYETVLENYELVFKMTNTRPEYRLDSERILRLLEMAQTNDDR